MRPFFLVGFRATGKTTVGRILAARLGWKLVDLDEVIVREAGESVPRIFEAEGEAGFRVREARALDAVSRERKRRRRDGRGGAACRRGQPCARCSRPGASSRSCHHGPRRRPCAARAAGRGARCSRAPTIPWRRRRRWLEARAPFYARAHLSVDTVGRLPQDVARAVLAWVGGAP